RPVPHPAAGSRDGRDGYGGKDEVAAAADAAARAFRAWSELPGRARADILLHAGSLLAERAAEIGQVLAREAGKRLPEAIGEVRFAAEYFRWFAEEVRRPSGAVHPNEDPARRHVSIRRPCGVVASLTPWNFPVSIQARKLAPALAAGCTVVARPSEKAPLGVVEMVRCLHEAGLPAGVLNLVHGPAAELTDTLLAHPAVRVVSFTGSTEVGRSIMKLAAARVVRPLLELGGDAPFMVFEDADLDAAVDGAMLAKFRNGGQSCIAANRFLVHVAVYEEFVERFTARIDAMTIGYGLADPVPDLTPLIDQARVREVTAMVDEALAAGAHRTTREFTLPENGSYMAPALLTDVPDGTGLTCAEVFGPAAGVFRFHDEQEALRRANATEMGLAGYFYTRDVSRVWRLAERLDVGIVGVNEALPSAVLAPMGGVKQSGLGREGAALGLEEFEDVRYLSFGV
ncbi:NAD-dependent succinate-semialdehyde dehydrogenase, partial [Streptomyces sp. NPDC058424]|uniref:NAD-dependent succinate-semialdehyde dehydrogenase n=1 Tax=Streptomyces sp. NPDC058424 TaxID=3346491 RepID=UPI00364BC056